jgi:hypothetical protein
LSKQAHTQEQEDKKSKRPSPHKNQDLGWFIVMMKPNTRGAATSHHQVLHTYALWHEVTKAQVKMRMMMIYLILMNL